MLEYLRAWGDVSDANTAHSSLLKKASSDYVKAMTNGTADQKASARKALDDALAVYEEKKKKMLESLK